MHVLFGALSAQNLVIEMDEVSAGAAGGRGGARGGAGARGARRAAGGGGLAPGRVLGSLGGAGGGGPGAVRARGRPAAAAARRSPPRADTRSFLGAPRHGGGGAEARRAREKRRGVERGAASPGGQRRSRKRNFSLPPPRARSLARVSPPGGWELHLRPGARGQGWTSGSRGEGCGVTCTGVPFAIGLLAASGRAGEGAPAPPARLPPQTVAGRSAACSFCGGCDPGRGPRHRGLPLRPPPSKHTLTHTHTLWRPSCHRSPQAWGGGAESPLRGGRRGVNPPNFPAPQAAAAAAREIGSPERARRLRPGRRRRRWGRAGARVPLCAIWLRRLVSSCRVTTLRLYCSTHRQ
ncbi:hypothetical protein R6Z07F_014896 [Ovis aries]